MLLWNTGFSVENVLFDLLELQHLGFVYKLHVLTLQVSPHADMYPDKTADISWCHLWLPCEMTSEQQLQKFHTDHVHYPGLCIASNRLMWISLVTQPIRSTTQIWVVMCHQYGISTMVARTSFRREISGDITKWQLFSRTSRDVKHFNH